MESKTNELQVISYSGMQFKIPYKQGTSIKAFKEDIRAAMQANKITDIPEFNLIYAGKKLLNEDESLSDHLKDDNNNIYTMAAEVHAGCEPKSHYGED